MSEPPRGPFQPGDEVGGFVIEAIAGRGGMGVVYRAHQKRPSRVVALKVIAPELADDSEFSARFERESAIAAEIEHPNVIPVHAVGEDDGVLFIAMRFVPGIDLGKLLGQVGRLEPRRAVETIDQVARALDAAHSHGLVHRDVKPANILLSNADGRDHVYLTDFGLSRHVQGSQRVTQTGTFLGTIDYVAPEQARAERVDARTDVYALGCVLFHALTGTVPFPLENDLAKLYAHGTQRPPSVCARAPDVPATFDPVLTRAMAKSPDDRYLSAGDLGRAATAAATNQAGPRSDTSVAVGSAAPPDPAAAGERLPTSVAAESAAPPDPAAPAAPTRLPPRTPAGSARRPRGRWAAGLAGLAAVGVGAAVLAGGGGGGNGPTGKRFGANNGAAPITPPGVGAFVRETPSVLVRRAPALAAAVTAQLPYHDPVLVVCTAVGDPVRASDANGTITTPVWDKVARPGTGGPLGYAPDAYIDTGTTRLVTHSCVPNRGRGAVRSLVRLRPSAEVRGSAVLAAAVTAHLPYRTPVVIVCTAISDAVPEPPGTPNRTSSPVWYRVRSGPIAGYVPDVFLRTPSYKPVAPLC